jgi:hypothetical protein
VSPQDTEVKTDRARRIEDCRRGARVLYLRAHALIREATELETLAAKLENIEQSETL